MCDELLCDVELFFMDLISLIKFDNGNGNFSHKRLLEAIEVFSLLGLMSLVQLYVFGWQLNLLFFVMIQS